MSKIKNFHLGDLIEVGPTDQVFLNPLHQLTEDYIIGRFGYRCLLYAILRFRFLIVMLTLALLLAAMI